MILTCPSCATGYFVPDTAIGADGRKVRCKSCSHVWHAQRTDEPLDLTTPPDAAPIVVDAAPVVTPEILAETPAPELPKAFRARAEQTRRLRRAAAHGAVWAGLASIFAGILAGAWLFRVEVVQLWPRAAAAYAAIGSPVNAVGLQFEAVGAKPLVNDPGTVVVSGALRNVREQEVVAPSVRVALLDAHGTEIAHRIVPIRAAPVLPGKLQGFAVLIPDPGARAAGVDVQFVKAEPHKAAESHAAPKAADAHGGTDHAAPTGHDAAAAGVEAHDAPSTADHPPAQGPAPAPVQAPAHGTVPPPTPAESGLRPAISPDLGTARHATPVDARPVAEAAAHH